MKTLGIIGFGQLGQFMTKPLSKSFEISCFDAVNRIQEAQLAGASFVSFEEACSRDIVILAVPINKFQETLNRVVPLLSPGALLIDVCSVKVMPTRLMAQIERKDINLIATHPLFGPQSGAKGIQGLKIVLCPIRISSERLEGIKNFLSNEFELEVILATPEEHDRSMAETAILSHFIGRALVNLGLEQKEITEPSFSKLIELMEIVGEDSFELFRDIQKNNPFASQVRKRLIEALNKLDEEIK